MADAEIDVVRDILAGDRAVRDCGTPRNKAPVASTAAVRSTTTPGSPR
jgi:hypothetical protein